MLQGLVEAGIRPDLLVGCSIGAINGAVLATDPGPDGIARMRSMWNDVIRSGLFSANMWQRARSFTRNRIAIQDPGPLRELLERSLEVDRIEQLAVPFQCVAASIERAAEHWFTSGPLVDALLASSAVPTLFPPVEIGGEHFYDGGLVNSVPMDRAIALGATEIFVLQVGRIEQPLRKPVKIWEPALVAFEIARRHRFATTHADVPQGVRVHLLPSGNDVRFDDRRQLKWSDLSETSSLIDGALDATRRYLDDGGAE